jgi:CBS-domain-containing membrane protein
LEHTVLIMLVSLVIAAALILCVARRTYPRDVATAMASECATAIPAPRERTVQRAGMV